MVIHGTSRTETRKDTILTPAATLLSTAILMLEATAVVLVVLLHGIAITTDTTMVLTTRAKKDTTTTCIDIGWVRQVVTTLTNNLMNLDSVGKASKMYPQQDTINPAIRTSTGETILLPPNSKVFTLLLKEVMDKVDGLEPETHQVMLKVDILTTTVFALITCTHPMLTQDKVLG